jgi:hypothetical protein
MQHFFQPNRWLDLIDQLRRNSLSLHGWTGPAPLELALAVGLAALKCENCGTEVNPGCPVRRLRRLHIETARTMHSDASMAMLAYDMR